MAKYKYIPILEEDYDALGITVETVLESHIDESGALVIKAHKYDSGFVCDNNCKDCPVNETDCDGECFYCPCFNNCSESILGILRGVCKSGGSRVCRHQKGENQNG